MLLGKGIIPILFTSIASIQVRSFTIQSSVLSCTSSDNSSQYIWNLSWKSRILCVDLSTKNLKNISIVEIFHLNCTFNIKNLTYFCSCQYYDINFYNTIWKYSSMYFLYLEQEWVKVGEVSSNFILTMYLFKNSCLTNMKTKGWMDF